MHTLAEEKKKEANVWKREIFFWAGVRKYLEKENIFLAEVKKNREGKGGKYLEKKNMFFAEEKERGRKI